MKFNICDYLFLVGMMMLDLRYPNVQVEVEFVGN